MSGPTSDHGTRPGSTPGAAEADRDAWVSSGLAALSGPPPGGRLGPPERLLSGVADRGRRIREITASWGRPVDRDWLGLLTRRAEIEHLTVRGRTSCGGAAHLMRAQDGWVAVNLARSSDLELLPAWLALAGDPEECPAPAATTGPPDERWRADDRIRPDLERRVRRLPGSALAEAAAIVGLPVGVLGEREPDLHAGVTVHRFAGPVEPGPPRRVVDLSSLWAGPLCGSLLAACGAKVVKVTDLRRPDGARSGHPDWYRFLNGEKAHRELALDTAAGRADLLALIAGADVVIESARPRGLQQLGIDAEEVMRGPGGPRVWVSITGHGRRSTRVAFGDDAAVSGGLVVHGDDGPWFCGDAIADPLSGMAATDASLSCLAAGTRGLIEISMAGVATAHAGATLPVPLAGRVL